MEVTEEGLAEFFSSLFAVLDERQRRLTAGGVARLLGRGGVTVVARSAGMSRNTVTDGAKEFDVGPEPWDRVRREGGGGRFLSDLDPGLFA